MLRWRPCTTTTAPNSGWSPSASASAGSRAGCPRAPAYCRLLSTRSWRRSAPRSAIFVRSRPAFAPPGSTTASPRRCGSWRARRRSAIAVDVSGERFAAGVEAAAYFVACEAVANAVKHGAPSQVAIRAAREDGDLLVSITDDGVGGAVVRRGSGLAGLRDRVAAHGGTLAVESPLGEGTRIEMAIPCES